MIKKYYNKLSSRDKRSVQIGAALVGVILIWGLIISPWKESRQMVKYEISSISKKLALAGFNAPAGDMAKNRGLIKTVPYVEQPETENQQRITFRQSVYDQLKKAGLNTTAGPEFLGKLDSGTASKSLKLKCTVKCSYQQFLSFIADIYNNPYLVSIEELQLRADEKNRSQLTVTIVVSTFIK